MFRNYYLFIQNRSVFTKDLRIAVYILNPL